MRRTGGGPAGREYRRAKTGPALAVALPLLLSAAALAAFGPAEGETPPPSGDWSGRPNTQSKVTTAMPDLLNDDMEYAACGSATPCNGWTHSTISGGADVWAHGAPSGKTTPPSPNAHSGTNEWTTFLTGNYPGPGSNTAMGLRTPVLDLSNAASATLTFWHYYRFEISGGYPCDGGIVEISTNGGSSWTRVDPAGGYPVTLGDGGQGFFCGITTLAGQPGYGATIATWTQATFDLTPHVGAANSYIRFHFSEDSSGSDAGWYIDDVVVSYVPAANPPAVTVTAPNGGETWVGGSVHAISWTAAQGDFPLKANSGTLYYGTAGCALPWTQIVAGQPTSGSYQWTVPNTPSNQACVRVTVEDDQNPANVGADSSNGVFTIVPGNSPPALAQVSPLPGGALSGLVNLQWDASDADRDTVAYKISLSQDSGGSWSQIATASFPETPTPTRRSVPFDTTTFSDRTTYRLSIEANDGNGSVVFTNSTGDWSIDNTDPSCSMTALPPFVSNPQIPLAWNGTDATSGIAGYDIMVSEDGAPKWGFLWNATNTSATFPGKDGVTYGFFCEPWDKAGNHLVKPGPDTTTVVDASPPSSRVVNMPLYVSTLTFDVPYTIADATATSTTIHFRLQGAGSWSSAGPFQLPKGASQGKGQVTVSSPGVWDFYSVATDQTGQAESKPQVAEDSTIVDLLPPSISASVLDTLVAGNKVRVTIDALDDLKLDHVRVEFMPADGSAQWKMVHNFSGINKPDFKLPSADVTLTGAADGKQKVRVVAVDAAGQTTASPESEVTLDLTRPEVKSISPADGAGGVPVTGPFVVSFSEPMNRTSVLAAIKITGGVTVAKIDWTGDDAALTLTGVSGNSVYTLTVGLEAQDVAGNRLLKQADAKFTTVPTHGSLVGSLKESGGTAVRGAVLTFKLAGETIVVNVSKDGTFTIDPIRGGRWSVHGEARGYLPLDTTVDVTAGEQRRADLVMDKDQMPTIFGAVVGLAVLGVVIFLVMRMLRKKCPRCSTNLPRNASACSMCGQVLRQRSKLDVRRDARLAREAESTAHRKAIAADYKQRKARAAAAGPTVGTGAGLAAQQAPALPRPTNCLECKSALKPDDEWCPKCGQAVGGGVAGGECGECGGTIMDGACVSCGTPAGGAPGAPAAGPRQPPPGTHPDPAERLPPPSAPVVPRPPSEPVTQVVARPPAEPPTEPRVTEGNAAAKPPCPTCGTGNPGDSQWCDVCGEKLS